MLEHRGAASGLPSRCPRLDAAGPPSISASPVAKLCVYLSPTKALHLADRHLVKPHSTDREQPDKGLPGLGSNIHLGSASQPVPPLGKAEKARLIAASRRLLSAAGRRVQLSHLGNLVRVVGWLLAGSAEAVISSAGQQDRCGPRERNGYVEQWRNTCATSHRARRLVLLLTELIADLTFALGLSAAAANALESVPQAVGCAMTALRVSAGTDDVAGDIVPVISSLPAGSFRWERPGSSLE